MKPSICLGFFGAVAVIWGIATWNVPTEIPCVPVEAVNYEGDTNTWETETGEVLLYSPEEDSYERCVK